MNRIVFSKKQIEQLAELAERFSDAENFVVESESLSGIGPNVTVRFDLFKKNDTYVDITDVENW